MSRQDNPPIFINTSRFMKLSRKTRKSHAGVVAIDMIATLTGGHLCAFSYDGDRKMRKDLLKFFVELPDGRWIASPDVFSAVDGNPGSRS
jgi:hypothetical protein